MLIFLLFFLGLRLEDGHFEDGHVSNFVASTAHPSHKQGEGSNQPGSTRLGPLISTLGGRSQADMSHGSSHRIFIQALLGCV